MVAGMSSRFGGTTPKQFARVGRNGETLIEVSVNDSLTQSFDEIVFVTNPKTEHLFLELFGIFYKKIPVFYVQQTVEFYRTRPWGTTDAVCSILEYTKFNKNSIFTIVNGDDLYGKNAYEQMTKCIENKMTNYIGGLPILDTIVGNEKVNRGLITLGMNKSQVVALEERLGISRNDETIKECLANVNFLVLTSSTLFYLKSLLKKFKKKNYGDSSVECFLTDSLNELIQKEDIEMFLIPLKERVIGVSFQKDVPLVRELLKNK